MSALPTKDFKGIRYLTLIARLLLNARGVVVRGELADAEGMPLVRFVGQDGLLDAIRTYLVTYQHEAGPEQRPPGTTP